MKIILTKSFLVIHGLIHIFYGYQFLTDPLRWMKGLSLAVTDTPGITEMRAFYGGLMLALGIIFLGSAIIKQALRPGLIVMGITYAGAVFARTFGIWVDQVSDPLIMQILAIEVTGLVMSVVGLYLVKSADKSP